MLEIVINQNNTDDVMW